MLQFIPAAHRTITEFSRLGWQIFEAFFLRHEEHMAGNVSIEMIQITRSARIPCRPSPKILLHTIAKECLE